jgi:hypothetical protein
MRERTMPSGAIGLVSKVSSKFLLEVMPVVLASVIGTMLVNHYSRQPASPSVIVQEPPPPAARDAMFQTLHDEHELIVDYLRRDADAQNAASAARGRATLAAPAVEDHPNKVRLVSTEKASPRPPPRPAPDKTIAVREPEPPQPDLAIAAAPAGAQPVAVPSAGSRGMVGTVRDWIINVSSAPARALAPRLFDDPPTPPLPVPVSSLQLKHEN